MKVKSSGLSSRNSNSTNLDTQEEKTQQDESHNGNKKKRK